MLRVVDYSSQKTKVNLIPVAKLQCLHCKGDIVNENGLFYAVGPPLYGALHMQCAPLYSYPTFYPHDQPLEYYIRQ